MKRYHINKTLIREQVHVLGMQISTEALEKFDRILLEAVCRTCAITRENDRKIIKAADLQGLIPQVQMILGRRRKEETHGKKETYVTA